MPRLYLDTAPVIYNVQHVLPYAPLVDARLQRAHTFLVASHLTWMECRVKPMRDGNAQVLQDFETFFAGTVHEVVPLDRDVLDEATRIRAHTGFKTPDSIHLAAAVVSKCDAFLTNDHRLDRFGRIAIEVVTDLPPPRS